MDTFITARQILKLMITTVSFASCSFSIPGIYVAKDNKHRNDSLFLYQNGSFTQKITDKRNNKILYLHHGTWEKGHNSNIYFTSIFLDGDSLYHEFINVTKDDYSNIEFDVTTHKGEHAIGWTMTIDLPETYSYYYKIKDYE